VKIFFLKLLGKGREKKHVKNNIIMDKIHYNSTPLTWELDKHRSKKVFIELIEHIYVFFIVSLIGVV
jgi:hypothetical protein